MNANVPGMREAVRVYFEASAKEVHDMPFCALRQTFEGIVALPCAGGACRGVEQGLDLCPRCRAVRAAVPLP